LHSTLILPGNIYLVVYYTLMADALR